MHDGKHEIILEVGAEGGTISLLGIQNSNGTWWFTRDRNESFHADMLSENDQGGLGFQSRDGVVGTFPEALNLLKEYPWHQLHPLTVHPDFRQSVFDTVSKLTEKDGGINRNLGIWKAQCGMPIEALSTE